jgi:hypothetical protein
LSRLFPNPTDRLVVSGTTRFSSRLGRFGIPLPKRFRANLAPARLRFATRPTSRIGARLESPQPPAPGDVRLEGQSGADLGLVAEEVAAAEPLLVTRNEKGEVEGVKYDRLSAVFINAFKEQQAQIERQQAEARASRIRLAFLRAANDGLNARLRTIEKALKKRRDQASPFTSLKRNVGRPAARQRSSEPGWRPANECDAFEFDATT